MDNNVYTLLSIDYTSVLMNAKIKYRRKFEFQDKCLGLEKFINRDAILSCSYKGNPGLHKGAQKQKHFKLIIGISVGVLVIVTVLIVGGLLLLRNLREKSIHQKSYDKGLYSKNPFYCTVTVSAI